MNIIKLLGKKHVKEILNLLYKEGELGLQEIADELGVHRSTASLVLKDLADAGLITIEILDWKGKMDKFCYKITIYGIEARDFYKQGEKLEEKIVVNININGSGNTNIYNGHSKNKE
ncbi:helix-turn-helix domain-containing protein [Methanococcus maripaludis]|uniref:Putative transcriptional regulator MarR n=1 Tax=Methanococcus maripaludis OS7 TaxID=637915 RepID=A0A2Z5PNS7_METMI|nr:MarR family transcriptional regulator [Methanococcus maripaludis]BAP62114.1 putative transcriptional regulator MarR [Methanococcus maripaludis OS7]